MANTLVLDLDKELAEFVRNQSSAVDPSAFIAKLVRDDMSRNGDQVNASSQKKVDENSVTQALEEHIDDVIPSAG